MVRKIALAVSLIGVVFLLPAIGCSRLVGDSQTPSLSTKPALPLLDTVTHNEVATAYFALG